MTPTDQSARVAAFYARNSRAFMRERAGETASGFDDLAIHRRIAVPGGYSTDVLNRDIRDRIAGRGPVRVLDAGSGWGGTLMALREALPVRGTGITLCPVQYEVSSRLFRDDPDVAIVHGDFLTHGFGAAFDVIVAVESIAHTADFARTVHALSRWLAEDGAMIVIDDFLAEGVAANDPLLRLFREGWLTPAVETFETIRDRLARDHGLELRVEEDYSDRVFRRSGAFCETALKPYLAPGAWEKADVEERCRVGGVALERLYDLGRMRYLRCVVTVPDEGRRAALSRKGT